MAQLINEAKRFQKLANIREAKENITPQQATDVVMQNASKLQNLPAFKDIANKIAEDPKATKQLMDLLGKYGINTNTLSENIDDTAAEKLSLIFAQKSDQITETSDDEDISGPIGMGLVGLIGGGPLANYILPKLGLFTHYYTDVWGQTNAVVDTPAMLGGAVLGALLGFFGTYVIGKLGDKNLEEVASSLISQQESIEQSVNEALAKFRKTGK
jgi:hypothetical protein